MASKEELFTVSEKDRWMRPAFMSIRQSTSSGLVVSSVKTDTGVADRLLTGTTLLPAWSDMVVDRREMNVLLKLTTTVVILLMASRSSFRISITMIGLSKLRVTPPVRVNAASGEDTRDPCSMMDEGVREEEFTVSENVIASIPLSMSKSKDTS